MSSLTFGMLGIVGVAAALIVKQWKSDFLPLIRIGVVILFGLAALRAGAPLVGYLASLTELSGTDEYAKLLFKALGIALLSQICADICRECGETAAANGVEWTGKVEILLLCLPMIHEILDLAQALLTLGTSS